MGLAKVLQWSLSVGLLSFYATLLLYPTPTTAQFGIMQGSHWCKCICFSNYTILPVPVDEQTTQPCLTCTKKWCLDQELTMCTGAVLEPIDPDTATGKEGDVEARCFERDSPRDQLVVTVFLVLVFGLLVGAAVKGRMDQANSPINWNIGTRRWWEAWLPSRQTFNPYNPNTRETPQRRRQDGYVDLETEEPQSR